MHQKFYFSYQSQSPLIINHYRLYHLTKTKTRKPTLTFLEKKSRGEKNREDLHLHLHDTALPIFYHRLFIFSRIKDLVRVRRYLLEMIEELIRKGQQVDAVHFTYEVGLVDKFPPVPLLKAYLRDSRKAATSISEDRNNSGRAGHQPGRKEQSALRAVIKCIEEYKLEEEYPSESLRKRLEQLEKTKVDKKRPAAAPANKRTRANNVGPMPPAKAGRITNAYVSSFPAASPTYVRSPSHGQYPAYAYERPAAPAMYGSRSPPAVVYSPEEAPPAMLGSYPGAPLNYPAYGGYGNGIAVGYQHAYYR